MSSAACSRLLQDSHKHGRRAFGPADDAGFARVLCLEIVK